MTGKFEHTIDAKGRLFIPAKLREELGTSFQVAIGANRDEGGEASKYLVLYPKDCLLYTSRRLRAVG